MDSQEDDFYWQPPLPDLARHTQAIEPWHIYIKNGDSRLQPLDFREGRFTVRSLSDDPEPRITFYRASQAAPEKRVIVSDDHSYLMFHRGSR
jgi:hypothetical protein